jgi:hypothetical protein
MNSTPEPALGDTTPDSATPAGGVFGNPNGHHHTDQAPVVVRQWTIEEILDQAKLPEKRARICLRADLWERHDTLVAELSALVDARGELLEDDDATNADVTPRAQAIEKNAELEAVQREMAKSMWFPLFRGMTSDDLMVFTKKNMPAPDKNGERDMTEYNTLLVAECSVDPKMSVEDVRKLRKTLGSRAIGELRKTATEVCTQGGVDIPKSPVSLRNLTQE